MSKDRLLIINADDFGMCHSTNRAIGTLLKEGYITSASIMMTCPWVTEAASFVRQNPQIDVGIHITHTSEWEHYKWGPLRRDLSTLKDQYGYFPSNTATVIAEVDPEELREEAVAQIELAIKMGIDPTNIDNHMGSMNHVTDILLELCQAYNLPLRYPKHAHPKLNIPHNEQLVKHAEEKGILLPDHVMFLPFFSPIEEVEPTYDSTKEATIQCIRELRPGITELPFHPSMDTEELKSITNTWKMRRFEFDVFKDKEIIKLLDKEEIRLITWRDIRNMQRAL
ncbi:ChbG/HpnK family deacetylase [Paenibacillus sp. LMG 31458]|uniref:ChbG/HpnK family deacetylase n=1 Tax=Paenibacillus phytorum TaxID=2654977 RepID=A0ABX1Y6X3_9BACL|nr:polysaccharide deacetylase family protein [Paenibacillus phytorum]NOU76675.1 ChbG/HpnK family deacetylase [Paenibacillus phytorum]